MIRLRQRSEEDTCKVLCISAGTMGNFCEWGMGSQDRRKRTPWGCLWWMAPLGPPAGPQSPGPTQTKSLDTKCFVSITYLFCSTPWGNQTPLTPSDIVLFDNAGVGRRPSAGASQPRERHADSSTHWHTPQQKVGTHDGSRRLSLQAGLFGGV